MDRLKIVRQRRYCHQPISTLYDICIRLISRNLELYNRLNDLSYLPQTIKTDLMTIHIKSLRGFDSENAFIRLLTSNIKSLMFRSTNVTDRMLQCIANKCNSLELFILPLAGSDFTQTGLCKCLVSLENLRVLHVVRNNNMTDTVLDIIGRSCKQLRNLNVRECVNVTSMCIDYESVRNMELVELDLTRTKITDDFLLNSKDSILMDSLLDISLRDCVITRAGLICLKWDRLKNINIIGTHIEDLSFIPSTAVYKTLNFSI